ncbi:MAG: ATP-dependent Clp protease proteolytic subunit [Planctomycetota bacterium]|nr:ATP-dependent Clp protease proteolytic subunit [Planctomycetota bacterium]
MATSKSKSKGRGAGPLTRYLLKGRSIMLFGPIEPQLTREVITQMLVLDQVSHTKPIRIYINSPGGVADDGFAIYDVIKFVQAPVYTIVTGLAASAATIVMVGATPDRRLILPHSRVMLHQPSVGVRGTASDIAISAKEIIRLRKKANELFERETDQPLDKLERDMHRDFWMSADEAVEYGLCDRIIRNDADVLIEADQPKKDESAGDAS